MDKSRVSGNQKREPSIKRNKRNERQRNKEKPGERDREFYKTLQHVTFNLSELLGEKNLEASYFRLGFSFVFK